MLNSGSADSVSATPNQPISLPVRNSWITSVSTFTHRSILAKKAVRAARVGKFASAIVACWK